MHAPCRVTIPDEDEEEEDDEEPKPVMEIDDVIKRFQVYLQEMHKAFDKVRINTCMSWSCVCVPCAHQPINTPTCTPQPLQVKIGDNPELSAEEVWEKFVELTEEHVMPLERDYAPAPVDEDGAWMWGEFGL